jgi:uncharacterized protein (TIGR00369 family)
MRHPGVEIPPKCFVDMEAEVIAQGENRLRVRFPVRPRYQNPMGYMQGGYIVAAIDNTIGPLSFLVAPPNVTTQLHTSYVRPVPPTETYIEVEASLMEKTKRQLFFSATVYNSEGKIVALATAACMMVLGQGE